MRKSVRLFSDFIVAATASLADNEVWCILHPEGKLLADTASKDVTYPIKVLCCALDLDWDEATEQGYRLIKITKEELSQ